MKHSVSSASIQGACLDIKVMEQNDKKLYIITLLDILHRTPSSRCVCLKSESAEEPSVSRTV